ncbi:hypothetical protein L7F22_046420 [Adiantum nelumboides]|nr:hypothetical protein [Adiantum nelumboides]
MGRTKRPEWQYVQQVKCLPKGKWTCKCNFCGRSWDSGPLRIRAHILGIAGHGVGGPCEEAPADVVEIVTRLHADARPEGEDRAAFVDALVNDLEGAASQAQGGASMSTHAKGTTNVSGSSKSNVGSSSKKRKVPQGGLASAFGLQAQKQANQALRRIFYAKDVSTWKARSPYFLQMVKVIGQAGPSYVPPSYHALCTTELNEEVKCVKTEIMDKGKGKLPVEESSSSTCRHRRETADTTFMASARTAARTTSAPRPSMTAEEQEENDLFTAQLMSMVGTFEQLVKNPRM